MIEVRWAAREDRGSAWRLLAGLCPPGVRLGHACPECGSGEHGRPVAVGAATLWVSLSRAPRLDLVAVSDEGPVGVDVEEPGAARGVEDVLALHPGDDVTAAWVRTEALLKALGRGLAVDPGLVRLRGTEILAGPPGVERLVVEDLAVPGHVAALARPRAQATGSAGRRGE